MHARARQGRGAVECCQGVRRAAGLHVTIPISWGSLAPPPWPPARCSTWRKLQEAGKTTRELGDVAQLRVVLSPQGAAAAGPGSPGGAPAALDYGCG